MRLRNVKNAKDIVFNSSYVILEPEKYRSSFHELFKNDHPIAIELGMGKGDFIIEMAKRNPNINFIGIEKYESVMVRAIQKLDVIKIPNLYLIRMDGINIDEVFDHEIDTLYLNFSDPWPKKRHEKRRLTSSIFLDKYDHIFESNPHIVQKTDNINLFAYSLSSLSKHGYILERVSLDLEHEDITNVETEYEKKFKEMGIKINYVDAVKYLKK